MYAVEIAKPGKLPSGKTEIPFEVPLKPKGNKTLYETFHGVFVNIQVIIVLLLVYNYTNYTLTGKSSVKLHNLFVINVSPLIIVAVACRLTCHGMWKPNILMCHRFIRNHIYISKAALMIHRFVHNLYIHRNGGMGGRKAQSGDQLNTLFCYLFGVFC